MKRDLFLKNVWSKRPYPQASGGRCGRVRDLGSLIRDHMLLAEGYLAKACLIDDDIVEVKGEQVTLLVPSMGASPFEEADFSVRDARAWQTFMSAVRGFFEAREFIELRTPTLVPSPGLEPYLDPFETVVETGRERRPVYLPTSPEFHLKKALALGFEKIFEFKECFRNNELSQTHQPEFLMLEWYRAYENTQAVISDVCDLLRVLQEAFAPGNVQSVRVVAMEALWKEALNFELAPASTAAQLVSLCGKLGMDVRGETDFDDLFARIFLEKLEPYMESQGVPFVVWHYPPSQAALARLTPEGWADRFEVYWKGLEIANAFHELNDAQEQRTRFAADQKKKQALGKKVVPVDEEFLKALEWGMPPSAGIALGVERLFMALFGKKTISQARLFPMK